MSNQKMSLHEALAELRGRKYIIAVLEELINQCELGMRGELEMPVDEGSGAVPAEHIETVRDWLEEERQANLDDVAEIQALEIPSGSKQSTAKSKKQARVRLARSTAGREGYRSGDSEV